MKTFNIVKSKKTNLFKLFSKQFSSELNLPIIDVEKYLNKSEGWKAECKLVAECLHDTGVLCIKDPVRFHHF